MPLRGGGAYQGGNTMGNLISEGFGINGYSLFGGFPDGAGFSLQFFLRQKRISAPIPNLRRLRGLREEAEWESLIRNFWGLGYRHASFFQPHFGRHIALGEAARLRALRGRSSREAGTTALFDYDYKILIRHKGSI